MKLPKAIDPIFSINDFKQWGDKWTRRVLRPKQVTEAEVKNVWKDLCLRQVTGGQNYYVHKKAMQLRAFVRTYGWAWFVRMPFKGVDHMSQFYSKPGWWRRSLSIVRLVDENQDGVVQVPELNAWVKKDGIRVKQYDLQISPLARCRAAAMLTFMLQYDKNPFHIEQDPLCRGNSHPLFQNIIKKCSH